jgi:hypothetical protein
MHVRWWPIKQEIVKLLQSQTLDMLAAMVVSGKYQLTDLPEAALEDSASPMGWKSTLKGIDHGQAKF